MPRRVKIGCALLAWQFVGGWLLGGLAMAVVAVAATLLILPPTYDPAIWLAERGGRM